MEQKKSAMEKILLQLLPKVVFEPEQFNSRYWEESSRRYFTGPSTKPAVNNFHIPNGFHSNLVLIKPLSCINSHDHFSYAHNGYKSVRFRLFLSLSPEHGSAVYNQNHTYFFFFKKSQSIFHLVISSNKPSDWMMHFATFFSSLWFVDNHPSDAEKKNHFINRKS